MSVDLDALVASPHWEYAAGVTWTADPEARASCAAGDGSDIWARRGRARVCPHVDRMLFSGATYKREHCEALGERVAIWIDDMPGMIGPDLPILGTPTGGGDR